MTEPATTTKAWKFALLRDGEIHSQSGYHVWKTGQWYSIPGDPVACQNGFHSSPRIIDAFGYVHGTVLAEVEAKGDCDDQGDKAAWQSMRITRAWHFTKKDAVAFAIYAAEQVLSIFETRCPGDDRPRKAIEAAKAWLADPSEANREAARTAAAAYAAAAYAAYAAAAAYAAYAAAAADAAAAAAAAYADAAAAAYAADAAAAADADAAAAAADAAYAAYAYAADAARAKAREELQQKLEDWLQARVPELELIGISGDQAH